MKGLTERVRRGLLRAEVGVAKAKQAQEEAATFEALMAEVDHAIEVLERGEAPLSEALAAFERGMEQSKKAAALLDAAEARLVRLVQTEEGASEVPMALPAERG